MDLKKVKPSKNFIDHTGDDYRNSVDWNYLLGTDALKQAGIDPNEALKGMTPEEVNAILFQRAWDAHGGSIMDNIPFGFPHKPEINTRNKWYPMPEKKKK